MSRRMVERYSTWFSLFRWATIAWETGISTPSGLSAAVSPDQKPFCNAVGIPSCLMIRQAQSGWQSKIFIGASASIGSRPTIFRPAALTNNRSPSTSAIPTKSGVSSRTAARRDCESCAGPLSLAPLSYTPLSYALGSYTPLSYMRGSYARGSYTPLSYAPLSLAPLSYAPGSLAPLSYAPGSYAPVSLASLSYAPIYYALLSSAYLFYALLSDSSCVSGPLSSS